MKTTTGCTADYTAGFDAGYKSGFAAGYKVAGMQRDAERYADQMNLAMDARIDALLDNAGVPVYQGRDTLCASCGKPVGDSPVHKQEYNHVFLYCSTQCRDYHAVGA
jgi:hypothetical protein